MKLTQKKIYRNIYFFFTKKLRDIYWLKKPAINSMKIITFLVKTLDWNIVGHSQ